MRAAVFLVVLIYFALCMEAEPIFERRKHPYVSYLTVKQFRVFRFALAEYDV